MPRTPRPPYQLRIAQWIVNAEARRDAKGRVALYRLPKGDGGGTFEVAGINDRYHPRVAEHLRELIQLGKHEAAEAVAVEYIAGYTDAVSSWTHWTCVEAFLRDCAFNRGPGGAAKIYQLALNMADIDGHVGPKTLATAAKQESKGDLLKALRAAREAYERRVAPPTGQRTKFWQGLINRWNASLAYAETFI